MNPALFKAYDIRGVSPGELDGMFARRLGKALGKLYAPKQVLVGHDMRSTSPELEGALVEGFVSAGVKVVRIGLCSTPMFNFAVSETAGKYDLGVMVTASHNPAKYNGFKLAKGTALPIGQGSGMEALCDLVCSEESLFDARERGSVAQDDGVLDRYLEKIWGMAALPERLPDWRVAIDAGNGMNGLVMPRLSKKLYGLDVRALYWDLDGTFPHHEANPLKVETLEELQELVKKYEAKFGVAFDGDGDRVGFVDELGEPIPGDMLTALFARELLAMRRGTVLYDLRSSWSVPEVIREAGGTPVMCRVGHAHIKKQMAETGALFGGELSMHFYFSELANCESGDLAMLLLLKMLLREQKPLSELWRPLRRYVHSGEMNFEVKDAKGVMARLEASYAPVATDVSHLDGLRMEFRGTEPTPEDWWFNVRASNTEPLLRLNLETRSAAETARRVEEVSAMIRA
jgi:phosphomannomutase